MLDIGFIRQNADLVRAAVVHKRVELDLDELLDADRERRETLARIEALRARKNEIAQLIPKASKEERPVLIDQGRAVKLALEMSEPAVKEAQDRFDQLMLRVPSIPRPEVPIGVGEADNVEIRRVGSIPKLDFPVRDHVQLMTMHDMVIWDGPRKFAGGRSYALKGTGALLELAVARLALDLLVARGLVPIIPPVMVKDRALQGTGFFPLGIEEAYAIPADGLFLVGTSEVPLVSLHCDDTLEESELPIRYAGMSSCFRREAGAHGKDTKGLYRVHQFTKIEQVVFCVPDEAVAEKEHHQLLGNAEAILEKLEIPYRVAIACTGEIGLGQTRKHEIESWMPGRDDGKGAFSETHSCSTLGDFQTRRSNIRMRMADGTLTWPYTLNNTAIASPRILIPLIENHQLEDGSIALPRALVPYMNGVDRLRPKRQSAARQL